MPLSAVAVQAVKPRNKEYKLADERGLYLAVTTQGRKHWRFKYRIDGKEKKLSFGSFALSTGTALAFGAGNAFRRQTRSIRSSASMPVHMPG